MTTSGIFVFLAVACCPVSVFSSSMPSGHLKPFGCCNPANEKVDEVDGWLHPVKFFEEYAIPQKPLVLKNAAKVSPAFDLWTDEYFSNMDLPQDPMIRLELDKKEVPALLYTTLSFKDWVRQYNVTDKFMVQEIPAYLGKDVVLPPSVQCSSFIDNAMTVSPIIWFSGGGTKSLAHTDDYHNINCVYAGVKHVILVDPTQDMGSHEYDSEAIDVERVDFEEHPDLANIQYNNITLNAGDCLFIPSGWIHQVNSYNRNIAISLWFQDDAGDLIDLSTCLDEFDPTITLDRVPFQGLTKEKTVRYHIKYLLFNWTKTLGSITFEEFRSNAFHDPDGYLSRDAEYGAPLEEMFRSIDKNSDNRITGEEYSGATNEAWEAFDRYLHEFQVSLRTVFKNRPDIFHSFFLEDWEEESVGGPQQVPIPEDRSEDESGKREGRTGRSRTGDDDGLDSKEEL